MATEGQELTTGETVGRYELLGEVGRGAHARVFRARHVLMDREVALKCLEGPAADDEVLRRRLQVEAVASCRIRHPAVVEVFDVDTDGAQPHLVMELLRGETLLGPVRRGGLSLPYAISLLQPVADALDHAHRVGVIHRDLKPENIFVEHGRRARLLDFGIARVEGESVPECASSLVGTPRYMAPEQVEGGELGPASDIYSFGVMLYEVLTGQPLFVGRSALDVIWKHASRAPRPPSSACPELPPGVDEPLLAMLEKRPEHRPNTVSEAFNWLALAARRPYRRRRYTA